MPILPLYGHSELRERITEAVERGTLPSSLLFHGPPGIGKQRLALWLGQLLVCQDRSRPCGRCRDCGYALELNHPDIHWYFPRPRPTNPHSSDEWRAELAEVAQERAKAGGLYPHSGGMEGIFVAMVRALVGSASLTPAMAARKIFIVGDAERMAPQEGSEEAANAFLKLLEEPPENTCVVLTSSEPGALLPTIRSRVVALRVAPLPESDVRAFLADPVVREALGDTGGSRTAERIRLAAGAPGRLLGAAAQAESVESARRLLAAARSKKLTHRYEAALAQGVAGARGGFSEMLEALAVILHHEMATALERGDETTAQRAARSVGAVEEARAIAQGNVSPQLLAARLLGDLAGERA